MVTCSPRGRSAGIILKLGYQTPPTFLKIWNGTRYAGNLDILNTEECRRQPMKIGGIPRAYCLDPLLFLVDPEKECKVVYESRNNCARIPLHSYHTTACSVPGVSCCTVCDVVVAVVACEILLKDAVCLLATGDAGVSQSLVNSRTLSIRLVRVRPRDAYAEKTIRSVSPFSF